MEIRSITLPGCKIGLTQYTKPYAISKYTYCAIFESCFLLSLFQNFHDFYFLITYEVCKKRKYYNRMSEKKILSFWQMFMICMS